MQVFVPHDTFGQSVEVLDDVRLGKQRVETYQIMLVMLELAPGLQPVLDKHGQPKFTRAGKPVTEWNGSFVPREPAGWRNHPAVRAWRGHIGALYWYQKATCDEWSRRGKADTCALKSRALLDFAGVEADLALPTWWGREDIHLSHRSNLVRKDPTHYRRYWPNVPDDLEYVWP